MKITKKLENSQCRTCYNTTKGLRLLTNYTKCSGIPQQKSYAELITEISSINIMEDLYKELPQFICDGCARRLKKAHTFVHQINKVNEQLVVMLPRQDERNKQLDCLQEVQVDIQLCLEIEQGDATADNKAAVANSHSLKKEEPEEISHNILEEDVLFIKKSDDKVDNMELILSSAATENVNNNDIFSRDLKKYEIKTGSKSSIELFESNKNESDVDSDETDDDQENVRNIQKEKEDNYFQYRNKQEKKTFKKHKISEDMEEKTTEFDDVAVPCSQCNKIFNNSKALMRHQRTSHIPEDQKCTCPLCFRKFSRSCNMYTHMRTFHGPDTVPLIRKPSTQDRIFQCDKCPRNYTKKKHLNIHIKKKHSQANESSEKPSENLKEDVKNETPVKANKPKRYEVRSLCSICGSSFSSKTHLIVHMRRHTGERPFKCDLCDRAYPRISELTCHRRIHTGEKPFACKICGKTFRVSSKMTTHMRSHTDIRPYKCSQCERSFKYSKDLSIHFRTHTGERPYSCNVCGSTFTQSNTLKAHRVKLGHIGDTMENINNLF